MKAKPNQRIESGLTILAKIIARQESKRQLAIVGKLAIFPSIGDIYNVKEPIKVKNEKAY